jgi:hypothetical protein
LLSGSEEFFTIIYDDYKNQPWWQQFGRMEPFATYLSEIKSAEKIKKGVDLIISGQKNVPQQYTSQTTPMINRAIQKIIDKKSAAGEKKLVAELQKKLLK